MKTLSLKLPEILEVQLNTYAKNNGLNKSEIIRRALSAYLTNDEKNTTGSFYDLAKDLAGSIEGPPDLSTNKKYLDGYGK